MKNFLVAYKGREYNVSGETIESVIKLIEGELESLNRHIKTNTELVEGWTEVLREIK